MKIKTLSLMCAIMLGVVLFSSQPLYAASTISLSPLGKGGFLLQGVGMENVSAMDITITYDASTLSNPRVTQGGLIPGALMAVNTIVAGAVRMGIVTTTLIKGDGTIATFVFDEVGNSPGRIVAIKANITNSKGVPLPVQAQFSNSSNEPLAAPISPSDAGGQPGATAPTGLIPDAGRQVVIGGGIVPSDDFAATAKKEPAPAPETVSEPVTDKAVVSQETASYAAGRERAPEPAKQGKKIYSQKSILDRFREYKGERSVKALSELFNQEPLIGFKQDPPIALADGKAPVNISFIATPADKEKPNVKIAGATLLSLKKDTDNTNTWIAELRLNNKSVLATLIVEQEKVHMVFPVVVAPQVTIDFDKSSTVTEADFKMFLLDLSPAHKLQYDLNNDGKRDFVDDYIFTANYIVQKQMETKKQTNTKLK